MKAGRTHDLSLISRALRFAAGSKFGGVDYEGFTDDDRKRMVETANEVTLDDWWEDGG